VGDDEVASSDVAEVGRELRKSRRQRLLRRNWLPGPSLPE
jgi:hypothetical protein